MVWILALCMHSCNHHNSQDMEHFQHLKVFLCTYVVDFLFDSTNTHLLLVTFAFKKSYKWNHTPYNFFVVVREKRGVWGAGRDRDILWLPPICILTFWCMGWCLNQLSYFDRAHFFKKITFIDFSDREG